MIPLNDTSRLTPLLKDILDNSLDNILSSGRWLLGRYNEQFAISFSEYVGTNYCLNVANGTDALEIALKALILPNKLEGEVITVANAGGYTTTACHLCGLTPVYIDVDPESMLIDINKIRDAVSEKTKAIVVTHLYGRAVDVKAIKSILSDLGYSNVKILEDCAQAHGAQIDGRKVGSLGDIATFSFYPTKNLGAVGDAGAIVTNSEKLFINAKKISQYGWSSKYCVDMPLSRNSRMDEIQAAILIELLPHLDSWNERRRDIYRSYIKHQSDKVCFYEDLSASNVVHLAVIQVEDRDEFVKFMVDNGVYIDIHYPVADPEQPAWQTVTGTDELSITKKLSSKIVSLPCFPFMSDEEVNKICSLLQEWNDRA